jgi:SAM-dependent methyltransferase
MSESTYDAILEAVEAHAPRGSRVLDAGSGRGEVMKRLSERGYEVHGCDADERCVAASSVYGEARLLGLEEVSPETVGRFDCVVASHVLEHVRDPKEALERLSSVSDLLVLAVPNPYYSPFLVKALFQTPIGHINRGHLYSWDYPHFRTFLEVSCGMSVVGWFYDSVALPVPGKVRATFLKVGLLSRIENGPLKSALPRFCRSIIAVVRA